MGARGNYCLVRSGKEIAFLLLDKILPPKPLQHPARATCVLGFKQNVGLTKGEILTYELYSPPSINI
jgi:hypothetical protein